MRFARQLEEAGAAALELNIYFVPGDAGLTGAEVEQRHVDIVAAVKQTVSIPVAVKLSPYFSSVGNLAGRLVEAGADGLVLFNRFLQPDVDVERVEVVPGVELSSRADGRLPRTWIAALRNRLTVSLDVHRVEYLGADRLVYGTLPRRFPGAKVIARLPSTVAMPVAVGETHDFAVRSRDLKFFDRQSGRRTMPRAL